MITSISTIISGTTANTEALETSLSSYMPPVSTVLRRQPGRELLDPGRQAADHVSGITPATTSARTVRVGTRLRRQTSGNSCSSLKVANWLSGTMRPLGVATCSELSVSNEARWSSVARATTFTR